MNKKFLSLVLALVMVLGTFGNVFAAAPKEDDKEVPKLTSVDSKVQWLIDNGIVIGNAGEDGKPNGDMALDQAIRRDAVAKMLVYAIGEQDYAAKLQGVYRPFPDVSLTDGMNGYIAVGATKTSPANNLPFLVGYEDGLFRPTNEVSYAELAKMLVVTIDENLTKAKHDNYKWTEDWIARAVQLGIFEGLSVDDVNAKAPRRDAFAMIYNAFYELKDVKPVPANETRGIISENSKGDTLVLNQGDYKLEYKVNEKTVFVNQDGSGSKWLSNKNEANKYYLGSLVRVLAEDGVATHIIEMGNPDKGLMNKDQAWVDLGNATFEKAQSDWTVPERVELKKDAVAFDADVNGTPDDFKVTSKTEFYVADYEANILTKVADYAAAKKLVADDDNKTEKVYLGYEVLPLSGVNEAKVVVFNKANVKESSSLVRVNKPVSSTNYLLGVQAPGEKATPIDQYDVRNNNGVWPYNYGYATDDVLDLVVNGDAVKADQKPLIKASEAPVYKVADFLLVEGDSEKSVARADANAIVLEDKEGLQARFDLPTDYDAFFGNEIVKNANVQILLRDKTWGDKPFDQTSGAAEEDAAVIDIISVVNRDLKGSLERGVDTTLVTGTVQQFTFATNAGELNRVLIVEEGNKLPTQYVTAFMNGAGNFDAGKKITFRANRVNKDYNVPEIVEVLNVQ